MEKSRAESQAIKVEDELKGEVFAVEPLVEGLPAGVLFIVEESLCSASYVGLKLVRPASQARLYRVGRHLTNGVRLLGAPDSAANYNAVLELRKGGYRMTEDGFIEPGS